MIDKHLLELSKFLSLVLRHKPQAIGLTLDEAGWADVGELLAGMNRRGKTISLQQLQAIVSEDNKQRYALSEDCSRIRANQGHSIKVELQLSAQSPPEVLYHGTATKNLSSIKTKGLIKGQRHHVHLSLDKNTAAVVGARHGKPVVLEINAGKMYKAGFDFFLSENQVWLVDSVPGEYIVFPKSLQKP